MYKAVIAKLENVRKHPGADRLQIATVTGYQIIIGMEDKEGDVGIFFPTDGVLSQEFAKTNDLIRRTDENGNRAGGIFDENCRIRAQKLRGEISEGFWIPIISLCKLGGIKPLLKTIESLRVGDQFNELDGVKICEKFFAQKRVKGPSQMKKGEKRCKKKNIRFPEHFHTNHFRVEGRKIKGNSIVYLSFKLHGTSARYGYVLEEKELNLWQRICQRFNWKFKRNFGYEYVAGTRKVNLARKKEGQKSYYGSDGFRFHVMEGIWEKLHKGEVLFGEIVGYTDSGANIQPSGKTKNTQDKKFIKQYGDLIEYKYGCLPKECKFFVYRISQVNDEGIQFDLPWAQVKRRCGELGLSYVPEVIDRPFIVQRNEEYDNLSDLKRMINDNMEKPSVLDSSQIEEGICIRIEDENGINILKEKSFFFRLMEEGIKDEGIVDTEEQEAQEEGN